MGGNFGGRVIATHITFEPMGAFWHLKSVFYPGSQKTDCLHRNNDYEQQGEFNYRLCGSFLSLQDKRKSFYDHMKNCHPKLEIKMTPNIMDQQYLSSFFYSKGKGIQEQSSWFQSMVNHHLASSFCWKGKIKEPTANHSSSVKDKKGLSNKKETIGGLSG